MKTLANGNPSTKQWEVVMFNVKWYLLSSFNINFPHNILGIERLSWSPLGVGCLNEITSKIGRQ